MTNNKKKRFGIIIFLGISSIIVVTCFLFFGEKKITQGEITYEVTYPYDNFTGITDALLPKEVTVIFKDSKFLMVIKKGKLFQTEIFIDEKTNDMEMRLDFGSDKFYTELDKEQQDEFILSQPKYTIESTKETDSLAGLLAKKYIVKYQSDTIPAFEAWFTEDLSIENASRVTSYAPTKGMPLIYDIDRYDVRMHLEVVYFEGREVKDSEFERSNELDEMIYKKYDQKLQDLFDVLTK